MSDMIPYFDAHMHYSQAYLDEILLSLDEGGIKGGINMWGGDLRFGYYFKDFEEMLRTARQKHLDTFVQFYWPVWENYLTEGQKFVEELCRDMRRFADLGCKGIKVWKDFGMYFFKADGTPATMDDPGLEPVWRTAAELGWTVAIHVADPSRNWKPNTLFTPKTNLTRDQIFETRDRVIKAHPEIKFMLCHAACNIEGIVKFGQYLDQYPHVNSDLAADWEKFGTEEELWAFLTKYADRVYAATDMCMPSNRPPDRPWNIQYVWVPQQAKLANWQKHVGKEVVRKITWDNAQRDFLDK